MSEYTVENWESKVAEINPLLLESTVGRKALCETDPFLFALIYFADHLKDDDGRITFGEHHFEWFELAKNWMNTRPQPRQYRDAFLAPRASGKSTFWFTILPAWWAAFGYSRFLAAFADSAEQAERHLATFKQELEENELLNEDFPELCAAGTRKRGTVKGDAKNMRWCANGFVFIAKGIDSQSLGMKVGKVRPDTLLFDDVEPDESNYSTYQMEQRLSTLTEAVFPLNERARVILSGTVTMPGSITHQLIKHAQNIEDPDGDRQWIIDENFHVHHQLPILDNGDGTERSMWPAKWPLEYLQKYRHTRGYQKNFLNDPMAADGEYWTKDDFTYEDFDWVSSMVLSIDGAVTTTKDSDYTGISVVGFQPAIKEEGRRKQPARCVVKYARAVKLKGDALRTFVLNLLESFPDIRAILVETNQGGDMWFDTLHGMPVKIIAIHNDEKKESRAGRLLNLYQLIPTRVTHAKSLYALEEQMVAFPNGQNDDLVDSVGNAVLNYLRPPRRPKVRTKTVSPR
jgi:phage terminase large subunit-like protein